jgi:hypothetical protein
MKLTWFFGYKDNPTNKDTILGPEGILITGFHCISIQQVPFVPESSQYIEQSYYYN